MKLSFKRIFLTIFLLFFAWSGFWLLRFYALRPLDFDDFTERLFWKSIPENPESWTRLSPGVFSGLRWLPFTVDADYYHSVWRQPEQGRMSLPPGSREDLLGYRREKLNVKQQVIYDNLMAHFLASETLQDFACLQNSLNRYDGLPVYAWETLVFAQIVKDQDDGEKYKRRLKGLPEQATQLVSQLSALERQGIVLPASQVEKSIRQLQSFVEYPPRENPLYRAFSRKMAGVDPTQLNQNEQVEFLAGIENNLEQLVYPAYRNLIAFLEQLRTRSPKQVGLWQYSEGKEAYQYILEQYAYPGVTPEMAHQWGMEGLAASEEKLRSLKETTLYAPVPLPPDTVAGLADFYLRDISDRIEGVFAEMPAKPMETRLIDMRGFSDQDAVYVPGSWDGKRAATLFLSDDTTWTEGQLRSVCFREGVPGTHLVSEMQRQLPLLPKLAAILPRPAYTEGWAAYADGLAMEYGFYPEPGTQVEYFLQARLRFALLILDTGIHHRRWTREKAINYLSETAEISTHAAENLTDKCIALPGRSVAAIAGERKLLELRDMAKQELGSRFNLRDFHHQVMANGPLPLAMLEAGIKTWINKQ